MNFHNLAICIQVYGILLEGYTIGIIALALLIIGLFVAAIFTTKDPKFTDKKKER
jgi:hypothetical protein